MTTPRFLGLAGLVWSFAALRVFAPALVPVDRHDAQPHVYLPATPIQLAAATLRFAESFDAAQVGFAGITPPEVLAWRIILQNPHRDSIFTTILSDASRPGQLYALAGLYFTDRAAYYRAARDQRRRGGDISSTIGCIGAQRSVTSIIEEMDKGWWTQEFLAGRLIHH